jgi:hypothetical protein
MPPVRTGPHVDDPQWETRKNLLCRLYLEEDLNLDQIVKFMSDSHGLRAQ